MALILLLAMNGIDSVVGGEGVRRRERALSRRLRAVGLEGGLVVARSALKEPPMLGAIVDNFVMTERSMIFEAVSVGSLALKVWYHESKQMARPTLRAWGSSRHLDPMFTHSSRPE
jgi:hypothetical protein